MISSLVCVVDDALDWVDSGENSRPKSCETVIPASSIPAMSPSVLVAIGYVVWTMVNGSEKDTRVEQGASRP